MVVLVLAIGGLYDRLVWIKRSGEMERSTGEVQGEITRGF